MKLSNNKVVVVTGAASGIGRSLAIQLAKENCTVAMADVNREGLEKTQEMIPPNTGNTSLHMVDVSDRAQVYDFAEEVVKQHGKVDIIINNAGVGLTETLEDVRYDDFEHLIGINLWGVIYGSKAFLPHLKKQPEACIVNVSSVHGLFTNRNTGPYCTSKFAVRGFTQTLRQELRKSSVKVLCVYPGGVRTDIVQNTRYYKGPDNKRDHKTAIKDFEKYMVWTSSDKAAGTIISGIKRNKKRILVGPDAHIYTFIQRMIPMTWQKILAYI